MNHFDLIATFNNEKEWAKVSNIEKSKNFFMLNRTMAIQYPIQANSFNHTKIEPAKVADFWKMWCNKLHKGSKPGFIWTSTNKKKAEAVKKQMDPDIIKLICEKHEISLREIDDLKEFYPKEFQKYYNEIKDMIS